VKNATQQLKEVIAEMVADKFKVKASNLVFKNANVYEKSKNQKIKLFLLTKQ